MKKIVFIVHILITLQVIAITPTPEWVRPVTLDSTFEMTGTPKNGAYYHYVNKQIKVSNNSVDRYIQNVIELSNITGVENHSQINIEYNDSFENVEIHSVRVLRDDRVIDRYSTADVQYLDIENQDLQLMYLGQKKISMILKDIRPDDILEYSYTISGKNPVFGSLFSSFELLSDNNPMENVELRVLNYSDKELYYKAINTDIEPNIQKKHNYTEFVWKNSDYEYVYLEDNIPQWYIPYPCIQISNIKDWGEVRDWAITLFEKPINKQIVNDVTTEIISESAEVYDQITELIDWVQNDIRYLGVEIGINSHVPRLPSETLDKRYGDCKDKVFLLKAMLKQIGVESHPVLVSSFIGKTLTNYLPSIDLIDHVILCIEYNGKQYYIDPTRSYQKGDLDHITQYSFGSGIIVNPDSYPVVGVVNNFDNSRETIDYKIDLTVEPITLEITREFKNTEADYMRFLFSLSDIKDVQNYYIDYYHNLYSDIEVLEDLSVQFDDKNNIILTKEKYAIPDFVMEDDEHGMGIDLYPYELVSYMDFEKYRSRNMPLALTHPLHVIQRTTVHFGPDQIKFDTDEFSTKSTVHLYNFLSKYSDNILVNTYSYKTNKDHVKSGQLKKYIDDITAIEDKLEYTFYVVEDKDETDTGEFLIGVLLIAAVLVIRFFISRRKNSNL